MVLSLTAAPSRTKNVLNLMLAVLFTGILSLGISAIQPVDAFAAWKQDSAGWQYQNSNGSLTKAKWQKISGKWYYFNSDGYMQTGFIKDAGKTYYLKPSGAMATGWIKDSGKWYYAKNGGALASGWQKVKKTWYYLDKNSFIMQTGWIQPDGKTWYFLKSSGAMATGWVKNSGKWYYFASSGAMQKSKWISGKYYVGADGVMLARTWTPDGYWVNKNGLYTHNGQVEAVLDDAAGWANSFDATADKLNAVASVVYTYVTQSTYGSNKSGTYAKPYGLIIDHKYTCAGTAAMSAEILSRMGYKNVKHTNKNQYKHQWAEVKVDGTWWIVEGQMGFATKKADAPSYPNGTVKLPNGMAIQTFGSV